MQRANPPTQATSLLALARPWYLGLVGGRSTIWGGTVLFCSAILLAPVACDSTPPEAVARRADGGTGDAVSPADLFVRDDCARATATHCATPFAYCSADATCGRALTCLANCENLPCDCEKNVDRSSTVSVARYASALECLTDARKTLTECPESDAYTNPVLKQVCPPATPQEDDCSQCAEEKCCESRHAYLASPEAQAVRQCLVGCSESAPGSQDCIVDCYNADPEPALVWRTYQACRGIRCPAPCGSGTGPCPLCQFKRCGDSLLAALLVADYARYVGCRVSCNGAESCTSQCQAVASPAAIAAYANVQLCGLQRCYAACSDG